MLGLIALLIGGSMAISLPWALPLFGEAEQVEWESVGAILGAMAVCGLVGGGLVYLGRGAGGQRLYRKEAIAVVGLSWLMATLLGALPFWLSGTCVSADADGNRVRMDFFDGIFESASGFSGTGATVLTDLESSELVPRAILFWRSETHFLGGLGIMVLFVAVLGMGSAGRALMVSEMPGPAQESAHARTQHAARVFASIFIGLTAVLTVLLKLQGMSWFDALCHAFGTIATGGFSTYNRSVEHFDSVGIEMTIALFMFIACINFTLLYLVLLRKPGKLLADVEFRVYAGILLVVALLVIGFGLAYGDFSNVGDAGRYGLFQVTSVMTNTGFGTANFNQWNSFSRGMLVLLMFIGGCAGSTSCSVKVIRHVLLAKILALEVEQAFRPSVVRHVRLGGKPLEDRDLLQDVLVYFCLILVIFVVAWIALVALEPDSTWSRNGQPAGSPAAGEESAGQGDGAVPDSEKESVHDRKLVDCASAVAATLNGVGPGLGIVGETENYSRFHAASKFILTWMMLLGRLEIFVLLVLFVPRFWRSQ